MQLSFSSSDFLSSSLYMTLAKLQNSECTRSRLSDMIFINEIVASKIDSLLA